MDTERSGLDEAMDVGSSTISHLKSLKTAATFSKAGYGAALGGPFSALEQSSPTGISSLKFSLLFSPYCCFRFYLL